MTDSKQLADAFAMMADILSDSDPMDCGPKALHVLVGKDRASAIAGSLSLVSRVRKGASYLETWALTTEDPEHLANGGQFKCYDDRRRQRVRKGYAFGWVEAGDNTWGVWDETISA